MRLRAFTLIELLVVIAIIAILAAILFPVFAQAKASAKVSTATSQIKQLALALPMYSTDYDDMAVYEYGTSYQHTDTWVGDVFPYVKNRQIFFDPLKKDPGGDDFADPFYPGYVYKWQWVTTFSLNTDGYSRSWGGTCESINWGQANGVRSLTAIESPAERLAIAPTRYANLNYSWMRFFARNASWPYIDEYATGWSWDQLIWDARRDYPNAKMVGAYADGHAAKFGREKFIGYSRLDSSKTEASTVAEYCALMDQRNLFRFWGKTWSSD